MASERISDEILAVTPEDALAIAWRHYGEGSLAESEALAKEVLRQHPHHPDALHLLGVVARQAGHGGTAAALMRQAMAAGGGSPALYADLAACLAELGDIEAAERHLHWALAAGSLAPGAAAAVVEALRLLGRPKESLGYAMAAIAAAPETEAVYLAMARAQLDLGDGMGATETCRRALGINPRRLESYQLLAVAAARGEDLWAAIGACRDGLRLFADFLDRLTNAARAFQASRRPVLGEGAARAVLLLRPDDPGLLKLLAQAIASQRRSQEAAEVGQRVEAQQNRWEEAFAQAADACRSGNLADAERLCRRILEAVPGHADAVQLLGTVRLLAGDPAEAIRLIRRALVLHGDVPQWLANLAAALRAAGKLPEAEAACRKALAADANLAAGWGNLGAALMDQGNTREALAAFDRSIVLDPDDGFPVRQRAELLQRTGRRADAEKALREWLRRAPGDADALQALAMVCHHAGRVPEAIKLYRQTLKRQPHLALAHANIGLALQADGRLGEAIRHLRRAVELAPTEAGSHNNLSLCLLQKGEFEEGLAEHEWRLEMAHFRGQHRPGPKWDGKDLPTGTLLLVAEQGMGDTILFVRYAAPARRLARRVVVESQPELARLVATAPGVDGVVPWGRSDEVDYAAWMPLLSLPRLFATRLDTIPAQPAYLHPPPEASARWAAAVKDRGPGLRIGLAWAGNPAQMHDYRRTMPLAALAPILDLPGTRFFSLQKGERSADIRRLGFDDRIVDLTRDIEDFADTAAIMAQMDLVISVCTSTAHLAGALGRPTWVLLSHVAHWVWFLDRTDSPWYPSVRLFRQKRHGDWAGVCRRVADCLKREMAGRAGQ